MSKIHYFQRYSTPENTVTNTTLHLFARICEYSTAKFQLLISELLGDEELEVGIEISQQTRGGNSVPDGAILQRSFKILIESKVDAEVDARQLVDHCDGFGDEHKKILLLLTVNPISERTATEIAEKVQVRRNSVLFKNVTYREICNALDGLFRDFEEHMRAVAEDYKSYCRDVGLISETEYLMRIVPTGNSFDLNIKYAMYFDRADRGYSQHSYIGFYTKKVVRSLIKIRSIFDVSLQNGNLEKTRIFGDDTSEFDERIRNMIEDARSIYDVATGHRFFCGDSAYQTSFRKNTPNGIMGPRFKNLKEFGVEDFSSAERVAESLKDRTWK